MVKAAIQLYSVAPLMEKDPLGTIERVAQTGFKYLEVANHNTDVDTGIGFGVPADELNQLLDRLGVKIISAHLDPDYNLKALAEYQRAIGNTNIVYSRDFYRNKAEVLARAKRMNEIGEECKKLGMQLYYHNHFHEFLDFDGEVIWDILMDQMDEDLVKVQLDTFWVLRAGRNPVDVMKKLGRRCVMIHQKDYAKGYDNVMNMAQRVKPGEYIDRSFYDQHEFPGTFTEIGTGVMDIQAIIDAGNTFCGLEYIILEQDHSKLDRIESVRRSKSGLERYRGVDWE